MIGSIIGGGATFVGKKASQNVIDNGIGKIASSFKLSGRGQAKLFKYGVRMLNKGIIARNIYRGINSSVGSISGSMASITYHRWTRRFSS